MAFPEISEVDSPDLEVPRSRENEAADTNSIADQIDSPTLSSGSYEHPELLDKSMESASAERSEFPLRQIGAPEIPQDLLKKRKQKIVSDLRTELQHFQAILKWSGEESDAALWGPYVGELYLGGFKYFVNMNLANDPTNENQCMALFRNVEGTPELFTVRAQTLKMMNSPGKKDELILQFGGNKYLHIMNHSSNRNFSGEFILNYLVGNYYVGQPSGEITHKGYFNLRSYKKEDWSSRIRCLEINPTDVEI